VSRLNNASVQSVLNAIATAAADATTKSNAAQAAAIEAGFGVGQTWQSVTRSHTVSYTNSTGKPIKLRVHSSSGATSCQVTPTVGGVSLGSVISSIGNAALMCEIEIPTGYSYSINIASGTIMCWELR